MPAKYKIDEAPRGPPSKMQELGGCEQRKDEYQTATTQVAEI